MIEVSASRRPARVDEVEAAMALLDNTPGAYFGCDIGIPGLHPLQATLVVDPLLAFEVFDNGVTVQARHARGRQLLAQPALAGFLAAAGRADGRDPLVALRCFLAAFTPLAEVHLLGALRFEAHRLQQPSAHGDTAGAAPGDTAGAALGLLFFSDRFWQRDAQGEWHRVALQWEGNACAEPVCQAGAATAGVGRSPVGPDLLAGDALGDDALGGSALGAEPADDFPVGGYAGVVAQALQHLRTRPLVSLTLSQSFRRRAAISPAAAFANLRRVNPAPASFFLHVPGAERLFGASPDLQLVVSGRDIVALPVCGTVARGDGPVGEAESVRALLNEDVDAASLAVCSDALRNDLSPLCEAGSLRLLDRRRPMSLATVVHTVDRLRGRLRAGVDAWDAIVATAAPVMLTGTPRREALRSIGELEASPRGWYGGLMLRVGADGDALVGTMLRAAVLRHGTAEVRTGGDLLADSDPPREEAESRLKALSLWRALGMADTGLRPVGDGPASAVAGFAGLASSADLANLADLGSGTPQQTLCQHDFGDPFAGALTDTLQALGWQHDAGGTLNVLSGSDFAACRGWLTAQGAAVPTRKPKGVLAFADAAACVLQAAGFAVHAITPEQGRLLRCTSTAQAPWPGAATAFHVGRYARLMLTGAALQPGWKIWAVDAAGQPVALAHAARRTVCLLWRPDSLLCDAQAQRVLQAALLFAQA